MEALLKRSIRIVSYGIAATALAFVAILFTQKDGSQYSHLVPAIDKAHADVPVISGDSDSFPSDGGGGDDDDDDDDDDDS